MTDFESIRNSYARHQEALAKANALNRALVFDALADAGITLLTVAFDGEGDEGQLHDITALAGNESRVVPEGTLAIHTAQWNRDELSTREVTLTDAIETLCYGYLEHEHGGWENNDGAYGEFEFDVRIRTVVLQFNGRYTAIDTKTTEL